MFYLSSWGGKQKKQETVGLKASVGSVRQAASGALPEKGGSGSKRKSWGSDESCFRRKKGKNEPGPWIYDWPGGTGTPEPGARGN
jgi:hypothetical protein